jgi:predicted  nucleic acid-binding Zn-ribbon protein
MNKYEHLSPLEVLIYNRIKWLTENGEYGCCSMSNGTLGDYFKRPKESISRTISKLKKLGYIEEEREGTLRKLRSTIKKNIYNYVVNIDEEVVNIDEEVVNIDEEVVNIEARIAMLKSLLNDEVVVAAMTKSLFSDEEVVKHNIRKNIRYIIDELKEPKKESSRSRTLDFSICRFPDLMKDFAESRKALKKPLTQLALKLAENKLRKLSDDEQEIKLIIERTILKGWDCFYELPESERPKKYGKPVSEMIVKPLEF